MKAEPKEKMPPMPADDGVVLPDDGSVDAETMATAHRLDALAEVGLKAGFGELPDGIVCAIVAVGDCGVSGDSSAEQVAVLFQMPLALVQHGISLPMPKVRAALGKVLAGEYCSQEGLGDAGMSVEKALRAICDSDAVRLGDAAFAVAVAYNGEYESARQVGLKLSYTGDSAQVQSLIAAALAQTFTDGGWMLTRESHGQTRSVRALERDARRRRRVTFH